MMVPSIEPPREPLSPPSGEAILQEKLTAALYRQLRKLAGSYMRQERVGHTMQATELVHEALVRLIGKAATTDRDHFVALCSGTMRRVLVDHARLRGAAKRGSGAEKVTLSTGLPADHADPSDVIDLDAAITKLAQVDEQAAKVIELRYFVGLTCEEAAEALDISLTSVERRWRTGREWLHRELKRD